MKNSTIKVGTRLTEKQLNDLEDVADILGFKSTYALFRWLSLTVLRMVHKDYRNTSTDIEVYKLFMDQYTEDKAVVSHAIENILKRPKWKDDKRRQRHQPKEDAGDMGEEIKDMFDGYSDSGYKVEFEDNIRKRK